MFNPCFVEFILGNIKVYLYILPFPNTDMAQVVKNPSLWKASIHLACVVNTMAADVLVT